MMGLLLLGQVLFSNRNNNGSVDGLKSPGYIGLGNGVNVGGDRDHIALESGDNIANSDIDINSGLTVILFGENILSQSGLRLSNLVDCLDAELVSFHENELFNEEFEGVSHQLRWRDEKIVNWSPAFLFLFSLFLGSLLC